MPPVTQVTHKQVYEGPITRSHAKVLKKEVNSLLAEINFNIHENNILPSVLLYLYLGIQIKRRMLLYVGKKYRKTDNQFGPTQ